MLLRISRALLGVICAAAMTLVAVAATGAGFASAATLQPLKIAYDANPSSITIVVAQAEGFYKKNGIDAKLTSSQDAVGLIPTLGKGVDLTASDPLSVLSAAAGGLKPMMITSMDMESAKLPDTYLVADNNIKSLKQLKGKTIGVVVATGNIYEGIVSALAKAGVSKTDVHYLQVPFGDMLGDLKSGTIQAAGPIVPFQKQMLAAGYTNLGDPILEALNNQTSVGLGYVGSEPWVESHKSLVNAFIKSQNEALAWIKSHVSAARQMLVKDFQLPAVVADTYPVYQYLQFGMKKTYLTQWVSVMKAAGTLPKSFTPDISKLAYTS